MTASVGGCACGGGSATGGAYALPATTPTTVFSPNLTALSLPAASPTSIATLGASTLGAAPASSTSATAAGGGGTTSTVVGHIVSANDGSVVMRMSDGSTRTFQIRPQDLGKVNPNHLQTVHTKPGAPDISMQVTTIGGVDYAGSWKHAS